MRAPRAPARLIPAMACANAPAGAREGDWGRLVDGIFLPDAIETEKRRRRIRGLLEDLLN